MIGEALCWCVGFGIVIWLLQLAEKYLDISLLSDLFEKRRLRASACNKTYPSPTILVILITLFSVGLFLYNYGL